MRNERFVCDVVGWRMTVDPPAVSVIVPTYNERANVVPLVDRCLSALAGTDPEILVVDDDSDDGTWRVVRDHYEHNDAIRVIRRTAQRGLATAITRGFREATEDICTVLDADLQHPPEMLPTLLRAFEDGSVDVAIASRYTDRGRIERWSPVRRAMSRGATFLSKAMVPVSRGLSDPLSGFFAVRRRVVSDVTLDPTGYKILLEVLARADYGRVVEIPYTFREREHGSSSLGTNQLLQFVRHLGALSIVSRTVEPFGRNSARRTVE